MIANPSNGNTLGLVYGWLNSGMFNVIVNNSVLVFTAPVEVKQEGHGFRFIWNGSRFSSTLTLDFATGTDLIVGHLKIEPMTDIKKLQVRFTAVPGHSGITREGKKEYKRACVTSAGQKDLLPGSSRSVDPSGQRKLVAFL